MINDIIIGFINAINGVYVNLGISTKIAELITKLNTPFTYVTDFKYYLSGVYFIFGKGLITYIISVAIILIFIRLALAIINLVYP